MRSAPDDARPDEGTAPSFAATYVRHGLPCVAVWGIYLAAFWPGILTEDSFEQWRDLVTAELRGYHSPLQTIVNWIVTRVWLSPAAVAIAQIGALSLAYTAIVVECARQGPPRWLLAATTVVFALLPANGFLSVTLWKDVPYTVAFLVLVGLLLQVARAPGRLGGRVLPAALAATLTAVATFRHNGLPTVVLLLAALFWMPPIPRRALVRVVVLTCGGVLLIQVGLFRALGVQPYHAAFRDQTLLHQVSAALRPGTAFDQEDFAALTRVMPISAWVDRARCQSVIPVLAAVLEHASAAEYASQRAGLRRAWWHAWRGETKALVRHHACVTGMIWNPVAEFPLVALEIVPNAFQMRTQPLLPPVHDLLAKVYATTARLPARAIVWGPALHLGTLLAGMAYVVRRSRSRRMALPFLPAVLHSLVLFVAIPSAEYRLQYPVVLTGVLTPLVVAALAGPSRAPERQTPSSSDPTRQRHR